ncbi:hypothetical protein CC80DRAFT_210348 [Byssothecium circinans]|uniref:Uncharacterized protein n=1 Tax=Byssothecium circinans TaxID=147558 RepID=A0A6A5TEX8_9PLEO|nr:hypothetical protein CC80DRAFT_210348 [Byssothecium circinans]
MEHTSESHGPGLSSKEAFGISLIFLGFGMMRTHSQLGWHSPLSGRSRTFRIFPASLPNRTSSREAHLRRPIHTKQETLACPILRPPGYLMNMQHFSSEGTSLPSTRKNATLQRKLEYGHQIYLSFLLLYYIFSVSARAFLGGIREWHRSGFSSPKKAHGTTGVGSSCLLYI